MQIEKARPPFVTFEYQAVEDRMASQERGHITYRDVAFAIITPQGSKDRIPREADDWFLSLERQVDEGRFPAEWLSHFRAAYKAWKEGQELPVNGTSIKMWPPASPGQVRALLGLGVRSVEDLANANEETLQRLGMGARQLKQRAVEWLSAAADTGRLSERISALQLENTELRATNEQLLSQLSALSARVDAIGATASTAAPSGPPPVQRSSKAL